LVFLGHRFHVALHGLPKLKSCARNRHPADGVHALLRNFSDPSQSVQNEILKNELNWISFYSIKWRFTCLTLHLANRHLGIHHGYFADTDMRFTDRMIFEKIG
jgi:hypothetical protein